MAASVVVTDAFVANNLGDSIFTCVYLAAVPDADVLLSVMSLASICNAAPSPGAKLWAPSCLIVLANVLPPVKVCTPVRCAVSESKYAEAIAVPCQVPVPIVPTVVILACVKCSSAAKFNSES